MLVENHLYAVVSLPAGIFNPYSGVKTSILLMDRQLAKKTDSILFVKIENDGFGLGAQRREIDKNDLPDAVNVIKDYVAAVRNGKTEAFITDEKPCGALLVKREQLAENGEYNLTADRYRTVETRKNQKWPLIEVSDLLEFVGKGLRPASFADDSGTIPFIVSSPNQKKCVTADFNLEALVIGDGGSANIHYINGLFSASDHTYILKSMDNRIILKYIYWVIYYNLDIIETGFQGQGLKNVSKKHLQSIKLPIPPLEVQREIVAEIESYQKLIDGCRQVVDSWKPQIDIDPEWPMVKLGDVCEINPQSSDPAELFGESEFVYIDITSVENGTGKVSYENRISPTVAPSRARRLVKENDVLLSTVRPNLKAFAILKKIPSKVIASTGFAVLRSREVILPDFLYYSICSEFAVNQMVNNMGKGAYPSINSSDVENLSIPLPPIEVQRDIVKIIESERRVIDGCRAMIKSYEDKIKRVIDKVWEE
jgi:type I restriction enzyme M protein